MGKNPTIWVWVGFSDDKGLVIVFYSPKLHPCASVRLFVPVSGKICHVLRPVRECHDN